MVLHQYSPNNNTSPSLVDFYILIKSDIKILNSLLFQAHVWIQDVLPKAVNFLVPLAINKVELIFFTFKGEDPHKLFVKGKTVFVVDERG